jgi:cobalt-zinc-cadmium efflux system protein
VPHGHAHAHDGHDHHHHDHDHEHGRAGDRRRLVLTLGLTGAVFVAELVGGLWSSSLALVSDAGHVFGDMSGLVVSLLAMLIAARPPTARRTFGYHRLEILAAVANGALLVGLAAVVFYEAVHRLGTPHEVRPEIMLPVAAVGLGANLGGAWLLHGAETLNVRSAYLHVLSDAASSLAVVVGAVVLWLRPGTTLLDPILGIAIAVVVLVGAVRLLREGVDVLLEAVPRGVDVEEVRAGVRGIAGVVDVHDLHIWTITSGLLALSAHLVVDHDVAGNDELLRRVKDLLRRQHRIAHSTLQIETTAYGGE